LSYQKNDDALWLGMYWVYDEVVCRVTTWRPKLSTDPNAYFFTIRLYLLICYNVPTYSKTCEANSSSANMPVSFMWQ